MVFDFRKAIIRDEDGKEIDRFFIKQKKKDQLFKGKIYIYEGGCKSYTERHAVFGLIRMRYYDYFYDDCSPYKFEKKIRNNEISPKMLGEIIKTDHIEKISKEARKGSWGDIFTLRNVIIGLIIIVALGYMIKTGKI